jgi:hypothetical protein
MSSLKQVIIQAIIKVAGENPTLNREDQPTAEEARDMFIQALIAELFPTEDNAVVTIPVKKSPKKSPEEKEAAKKAKAEAKAAKEAEKKAKAEAKESAKAAKAEAKKPKEEVPQTAEVPALPVSPPKKAKKAPKVVDPSANLQKIDPTWRKALKEADKEHAKELEPELLKYVNDMSNVAFHGKGVKEHVTDFLASRKPEPVSVETDLEVVEFNGKDYYVNPETKRVYEGEMDTDGNLKVTRPVGYVGMAEFKDMVLE